MLDAAVDLTILAYFTILLIVLKHFYNHLQEYVFLIKNAKKSWFIINKRKLSKELLFIKDVAIMRIYTSSTSCIKINLRWNIIASYTSVCYRKLNWIDSFFEYKPVNEGTVLCATTDRNVVGIGFLGEKRKCFIEQIISKKYFRAFRHFYSYFSFYLRPTLILIIARFGPIF